MGHTRRGGRGMDAWWCTCSAKSGRDMDTVSATHSHGMYTDVQLAMMFFSSRCPRGWTRSDPTSGRNWPTRMYSNYSSGHL